MKSKVKLKIKKYKLEDLVAGITPKNRHKEFDWGKPMGKEIMVERDYITMKKSFKSKGFTLVELLVVVAIIGILASVVLTSLNSARAKGRNARRVSDIKQLVNAFNLALTATNSFPASAAGACVSSSCYGAWSGNVADSTVDAFFTPYLSKSSDPQDGVRDRGGYVYRNPFTGTAPYDGYVLPSGVYLQFAVEPPTSSTACAGGRIWNATASLVECFLKLD